MRENVDFISGQRRPLWRGRLHAGAAGVAVPAGLTLTLAASGIAAVAAAVYSAALVAVYAVSASYHLLARSPRAQQIMRRVDHATIFVLIAGTATPLCLLAAPGRAGSILLSAVWVGASAGIALKATGTAWRVADVMYIVLGLLAAACVPSLWQHAGPGPTMLVIGGGLIYAAGAAAFYTQRPSLRPAVFGYHECWHVATLVAGVCHFAAVATLVN
jgi:hemolysin III